MRGKLDLQNHWANESIPNQQICSFLIKQLFLSCYISYDISLS